MDVTKRDAETITFTASPAINQGVMRLIEDTYIISYINLLDGETGEGIFKSNGLEVPKDAGVSFSNGDFLWVTPGASPLTVHPADAGSDVKVGIAVRPATNTDETVFSYFCGFGI